MNAKEAKALSIIAENQYLLNYEKSKKSCIYIINNQIKDRAEKSYSSYRFIPYYDMQFDDFYCYRIFHEYDNKLCNELQLEYEKLGFKVTEINVDGHLGITISWEQI